MTVRSQVEMLVAQNLGNLQKLCDTGFALAVHIRLTRPTLLFQTYARDWTDHYSVKGYMLADPTVHWGLANTGTKDWADLQAQDPQGVIADALSHGLNNGWTYATGPSTSRSICSMTRSDPFSEAERNQARGLIDQIHAQTEGFDSFPDSLQDRLRRLF